MRLNYKSVTFSLGLCILLQINLVSCAVRNRVGPNITLTLNSTLSGEPSPHYPVKVVLSSDSKTVNIDFFAPYLGDDSTQRLHVFLANEDKRIVEFDIAKEEGNNNNATIVARLYWAPYNVIRVIKDLEVKSAVADSIWSGSAEVPVTLLPPRPSLCNVAMEHFSSEDRHWDNLYSITNAGIAIGDMMVVQRYKKINSSILSSETSYSPEWKPS